jgi:ATP-dependent protease ClpP protease subunit
MNIARFFILFTLMFPLHSIGARDIDSACGKIHYLYGDIHTNNHELLEATTTAARCLSKDSKRATVAINSHGGSVELSFEIHKKLSRDGELTTIGSGVVNSGATLAFLAGKVRILMCDSTMLVHEPSYSMVVVPLTIDRLKHLLSDATVMRDHMARIYADRTGMTITQATELMHANKMLTAREALELGFATQVVGQCNTQ